jgi:hypothetical protein
MPPASICSHFVLKSGRAKVLAGVSDGGTVSVPVIGHVVCAGFPSPAQDSIEGNVELPRWMAPITSFQSGPLPAFGSASAEAQLILSLL